MTGRETGILDFPKIRTTKGYRPQFRAALLYLCRVERRRRIYRKLVRLMHQAYGGPVEYREEMAKAKLTEGLVQLAGMPANYAHPPRTIEVWTQPEQCTFFLSWERDRGEVTAWWGHSRSGDSGEPYRNCPEGLLAKIIRLGVSLFGAESSRRWLMLGKFNVFDTPFLVEAEDGLYLISIPEKAYGFSGAEVRKLTPEKREVTDGS